MLGLAKLVEPTKAVSSEPVRIVLKPSRVTKVHVRDVKDQPVPAATVAAIGFDFNDAATTDAGGDAVLRVPADAQVWWIAGLKNNLGFDYFENYRSLPAGDIGPLPADVTVRLDGSRSVRIKAVDSAGRPVPGVEFRPWTIRKPRKLDRANIEGSPAVRSRTDDTGMATFGWLPANDEEDLGFLIYPSEYSCPASPLLRSGSDGVVLEARLLGHTRIAGTVRDRNGKPAAGILIRAEGRGATNMYCRRHTRTRADGSYAMDVYPEQSYMIAVLDERSAVKSRTDVIVHEGKPMEGLDFTLVAGTLIHGVVTKRAGGPLMKGETITLVEHGPNLPPELVSPQPGNAAADLPQWTTTDALGHYQFRVGPGHFTLSTQRGEGAKQLTVENQAEIVHDLQVSNSSERKSLSGLAIEKTPAGERPIPGALIEAAPVGRHGVASRAIADASGRFQLSVPPGTTLTILTRDTKETIAGFTQVAADTTDVRAFAAPASRISGRVIDAERRPVPGRRVQLQFADVWDFRSSTRFNDHTRTDANGRYEFRGVVVGAHAELCVYLDDARSALLYVESVNVRGPDPIELPDVGIPSAPEKPTARAIAATPNAAAAYRPVSPGRTDLEALLRAIGRGAVTPEMIDRAWLMTRPQFHWYANVNDIRENLADKDFRRLVDEAADQLTGKPADTLTVFYGALYFGPGSEIGYIKSLLEEFLAVAEKPVVPLGGTVVDSRRKTDCRGSGVFGRRDDAHRRCW